jgi:hypothetical protein
MFPYMTSSKVGTVAIITVGNDFIGAVMGLHHGSGIDAVLASWQLKEAVAA